ncbi:MAG: DNA-directed RNA polymerase subunit omega [Lachnospiraceae bacterium]|nr:DNA-directed RNA polymerase subunit omega [Lachnospiraceae bacterium]
MIHPSYVDLMEVVNKGVEEGETPVINSRYSIVMATAKRARQIVDGDEPLIDSMEGEKPLSIAVEELNQEKIRILSEEESEEAEKAELEAAAGEEPAAELPAELTAEEPGEEIVTEYVEEDSSDAEYEEG